MMLPRATNYLINPHASYDTWITMRDRLVSNLWQYASKPVQNHTHQSLLPEDAVVGLAGCVVVGRLICGRGLITLTNVCLQVKLTWVSYKINRASLTTVINWHIWKNFWQIWWNSIKFFLPFHHFQHMLKKLHIIYKLIYFQPLEEPQK